MRDPSIIANGSPTIISLVENVEASRGRTPKFVYPMLLSFKSDRESKLKLGG